MYWHYLFKYFDLCETYVSPTEKGKNILNIYTQINRHSSKSKQMNVV